jgi:hypothetical protein
MPTTLTTLCTSLPDSEAGPKETAGWYFISEMGEAYLPEDATKSELAAIHADYEADGKPYTAELCTES